MASSSASCSARGGVHLVDHDRVGHADVRLARVVRRLVPRPQRIRDDDAHGRPVEREVVVPAVPEQDVALRLRLRQDVGVVDAGVDDRAGRDVRLVLLALLDRGLVAVEVLERRVALHALGVQVAVRHRVPHRDDPLARVLQHAGDRARRLALAGAGAHGADRHDGNVGIEHGRVRPQEHEVGAGRHGLAALVHHVLVRDVGVREHDVVDIERRDELGELGLVVDLDAVRVVRARELRRVHPVVDERDLGRRERHDLRVGIVAEHGVEVVEVATGGSHDEDATRHGLPSFRKRV